MRDGTKRYWQGQGTHQDRGCFTILSINLMTLNLVSSIISYCNESKRVGKRVKPLM